MKASTIGKVVLLVVAVIGAAIWGVHAAETPKEKPLDKGQQAMLLLKYQKATDANIKLQEAVQNYNAYLIQALKDSGNAPLCKDNTATECSLINIDTNTDTVTVTYNKEKPKPDKK